MSRFNYEWKKGDVIEVEFSYEELANLTFGTREVIQRMLKDLREKDVVSYNQQHFTVKNLAYLKREVDCQNCNKVICGVN